MAEILTGVEPTVEDGRISERRVGPITRTDIVRYAGAGGDFNPIHYDDEFARSARYPSVFAMGMLTAGLLSGYVEDAFGRENVRRFAVRYTAQVWPGDVLVMSGTRRGEGSADNGEFELTVRRDAGEGPAEVVLSGSVVAARVRTAAHAGGAA